MIATFAKSLIGLTLAVTLAGTALAQNSYHVRGTVTGFNGDDIVSVAAGDGAGIDVTLKHRAKVFTVVPGTIDEIAQGVFVGIASIESGGERTALEVHILDDSLRGRGEGHYPWTLVEEENMMTHATVAEIASVDNGQRLTLTYQEGPRYDRRDASQTITVPRDVPVVRLMPAERQDLIAGETIFLIANDIENVGPMTPAIVVGRDGLAPPM